MGDGATTQLSLFDKPSELGDDLLIGAEEIARYLNWRGRDGTWMVRRVYHVAEMGSLPIHKQAGLGLVARKSALKAHFAKLDEPFLERSELADE